MVMELVIVTARLTHTKAYSLPGFMHLGVVVVVELLLIPVKVKVGTFM